MQKIIEYVKKNMQAVSVVFLAVLMLFDSFSTPADACMDYQDMICAGAYHTAFLRGDGTVVAFGKEADDRCDVEDWTDVIAISAESHTVGLRSDGRVYATGCDTYGQCGVFYWKDIVMVPQVNEIPSD